MSNFHQKGYNSIKSNGNSINGTTINIPQNWSTRPATNNRPHFAPSFRYSSDQIRAIERGLDSALKTEDIHYRKQGGVSIPYIPSEMSFSLANRIFGSHGWSSQILSTDVMFHNLENGKYTVLVKAHVLVTIENGSFHEDIGFGENTARKSTMAIETSTKAAITDGVKRCLRYFGIGLDLYNKRFTPTVGSIREDLKEIAKERMEAGKTAESLDFKRSQINAISSFFGNSSSSPMLALPQPSPDLTTSSSSNDDSSLLSKLPDPVILADHNSPLPPKYEFNTQTTSDAEKSDLDLFDISSNTTLPPRQNFSRKSRSPIILLPQKATK